MVPARAAEHPLLAAVDNLLRGRELSLDRCERRLRVLLLLVPLAVHGASLAVLPSAPPFEARAFSAAGSGSASRSTESSMSQLCTAVVLLSTFSAAAASATSALSSASRSAPMSVVADWTTACPA
eukprot:7391458-Prymnesium_polylepis.1